MEYNINFCIISAAYLFITAVFYKTQGRMVSRRSKLFAAMLLCGIFSLVLDIFVAVLDPYAYLWPVWLVYLANFLFLFTTQFSGLLLFYYSVNLSGTYMRMPHWLRAVIALPFMAVTVMLLLSPISQNWIFYLDGNNVYHHGASHMLLYAAMALYLVSSLVIVFIRRRQLQRLKFFTILAFLVATLTAMLIQMNHPHLLVNSTANAFALMLMYYILEAPNSHVDALTGVLNRTALLPALGDIFDERERCTLLIYSLNSLHIVNHSFGMRGGDEALAAFAKYLQQTYPKNLIFRVEGDIFGVLLRGDQYMQMDRLGRIYAGMQTTFSIEAGQIALDASLACVNSEDCRSAAVMMRLIENLLGKQRGGWHENVLLVDKTFLEQENRKDAIEKATMRALDEDRIQVYYQPIHDAAGKLCALEALVRITDPEMGMLPTQELVELAERNGSITRLGEQVLRKTCTFIRENEAGAWGLDHVGVNLSAVQCMQPELPELIGGILREYDVPSGLISFEVTETTAGVLTSVKANMDRLGEKGIHFLLDDFGTGYANFKNMTALPYRCIKLDKSLLWNAQRSGSRMRMLSGVVRIVHALGMTSLCEGVETKEQMDLLISLGVSMMQGYYFSKPLPPEELLAYVGKAGEGK